MVSVNGNGNVNNNLFVGKELQPLNPAEKPVNERIQPDNKAIGEFGDKLLEQVQPKFVQTAKIPQEDADELTEMFTIAGITKPKMPTVVQYASISGHVGYVSEGIDKLATTNNAERLFNSEEFEILNQYFDIS